MSIVPLLHVSVFVLVCLCFCRLSLAGEEGALLYEDASNWVAKPETTEKPVDVFYVYPTIYNGSAPLNMNIEDPALQKKAQHLLASQAGVYSPSCNLFAPYYRQMSMAALDSDEDTYANPHFLVGANDVIAAFEYYIKHLNQGRPFLLAGHSQGSMALIHLMRHRFEDPELQRRLIAAYLIGYSVTEDDVRQYPWIRPAQGAGDTGVVISFNTQSPDAVGSPVLLPGAICINPLSWTTTSTPAPASMNRGAVFFDDETGEIAREVEGYAGAAVNTDRGALETQLPEELSTGSFPKGVYHRYDYAIWYRNLEENVRQRIAAFFQEVATDEGNGHSGSAASHSPAGVGSCQG